jgi:hypothetical protein
MKVQELKGALLDYWAGKADKLTTFTNGPTCFLDARVHGRTEQSCIHYSPSTNWAQGGPIIEREKISVEYTGVGIWEGYDPVMTGQTFLETAMRCFVASKFGEEVPDA